MSKRCIPVSVIGVFLLAGMAAQDAQGASNTNGADPEDRGTPIGSIERIGQFDFIRMNESELRRFYKRSGFGDRAKISGFSREMSDRILDTAAHVGYRRRLQRLVEDMRSLDDRKSRMERLEEEHDWARDFERNLERSVERLEAKDETGNLDFDDPVSDALREERNRLSRVRSFRFTVEDWLINPMEGTF